MVSLKGFGDERAEGRAVNCLLATFHSRQRRVAGLKIIVVVAGFLEGGGFLVFGDFSFEEVLLLLEVDGFGEPWERVRRSS